MSGRGGIYRRQGNENRDPYQDGRSYQPDQSSAGMMESIAREFNIPFAEVVRRLNNANLPPQLRQTPYLGTLTVVNKPKLLIPANPNRMSFIVNFTDYNGLSYIYGSYNFPPATNCGVFITTATPFSEGNGTVSIDDIYVYTDNAAALNIPILAYEGVLAVESHLQRNTADAAR